MWFLLGDLCFIPWYYPVKTWFKSPRAFWQSIVFLGHRVFNKTQAPLWFSNFQQASEDISFSLDVKNSYFQPNSDYLSAMNWFLCFFQPTALYFSTQGTNFNVSRIFLIAVTSLPSCWQIFEVRPRHELKAVFTHR